MIQRKQLANDDYRGSAIDARRLTELFSLRQAASKRVTRCHRGLLTVTLAIPKTRGKAWRGATRRAVISGDNSTDGRVWKALRDMFARLGARRNDAKKAMRIRLATRAPSCPLQLRDASLPAPGSRGRVAWLRQICGLVSNPVKT